MAIPRSKSRTAHYQSYHGKRVCLTLHAQTSSPVLPDHVSRSETNPRKHPTMQKVPMKTSPITPGLRPDLMRDATCLPLPVLILGFKRCILGAGALE